MGEKHQNKWLDFLPFVLLGRRVAYQPDIKASAAQLTFGVNPRIPGQILHDPGEVPSGEELQTLLEQIRNNVNKPAIQPSNHSAPEVALPDIPEGVTKAYVRQHKKTGLQAPFEGPFDIAERISRSTVKLHVGNFKDGTKKYEIRHANDLKFTHPDSLAAPIHRPSRGRPRTSVLPDVTIATDDGHNKIDDNQPDPDQLADQPEPAKIQTRARPVRSTRNPDPLYVDAITVAAETGPPPTPPFPRRWWSASPNELAILNKSINSKRGA